MGRDRDEYEIDDASTRLAKHQSGGRATINIPSGLNVWKPKKSGSHTIEIIPFKVTDNHLRYPKDSLQYSRPGRWYFERTFYAHRNVGVNNEWYTCIAKTFGKACPICEARQKLNQSPHKDDEQKAKELKPKDRQLFLIYDLDDTDRGVQLWEESNWNFGRFLDKYIEGARPQDKDAYKRFFHPIDGFTVRITATEVAIGGRDGGKGGNNTEYSVHQFYKRDRDLPSKLFDHGYDLDAMVRELEYKQLKDLYDGFTPEDIDPEENGKASSHRATGERREEPRRDRDALDDERERDKRDEERERKREVERTNKRDERSARDEEPPARSRRDEPEPVKSKPKDKVDFGSKDLVKFDYKGETVEAEIEKVDLDKRIAYIPVPGRDRPSIQDFEDLTMVKAFDGFDKKSKPKDRDRDDDERDKKTDKWKDDDDGRSFSGKRPRDDDDDEPPPRRK